MLIAREKESALLQDALRADDSQFIAVYGRHRVGKTYLIRQTFGDKFIFEHTGLAEGGMKDQLHAFTTSLRRFGLDVDVLPTYWIDAFELLKDLIIR